MSVTAALAGSTGLTVGRLRSTHVLYQALTRIQGSKVFELLIKRPEIKTFYGFGRRELPTSSKAQPLVSTDTSTWPSKYPTGVDIFLSGLGTTRAAAGGTDNQYKIDYQLNYDLAKAAKAAGTKTYVLISSAGANVKSSMFYARMKGQLEEDVKALDFDHFIIVRPGLIVGNRGESRMAEGILRSVANLAGTISGNVLKDGWAQDADVIAKAAVRAGLDAVEGKDTSRVRVLAQADIIRLGREEWKD